MVTLEEFREELGRLKREMPAPDAALVDTLLQRVAAWPDDSSSLEKLAADLERLLGHVWFSTNERHALVNLSVARFKDLVGGVDGMTMNERLYLFGLESRWARATEPERIEIYSKVGAKL